LQRSAAANHCLLLLLLLLQQLISLGAAAGRWGTVHCQRYTWQYGLL
jgi:hypothetical protein